MEVVMELSLSGTCHLLLTKISSCMTLSDVALTVAHLEFMTSIFSQAVHYASMLK